MYFRTNGFMILFQNLLYDLKGREAQFNSVQDRGNSMVLDRHPASQTIEVRYHDLFTVKRVLVATSINFLPNNKMLDLSKLKTFADDRIGVIEKLNR